MFPLDFLRRINRVIPRRLLIVILLMVPIILLASLPLIARTQIYPIAIVDGNSMVPALHNGDLVYFTAPRGPVSNGTVIVFIQGQTGAASLDALVKPIVVHRVVGFGYNPDGSLYYQTKGDNNAGPDPFVTPASSVLGVESTTVPYAGLPLQFLKTAYGMLTVVAVMSLYYFSGVDTRLWEEDERKRLVTLFARDSLNGTISPDQFEKLKLVIECSNIPDDLLNDPTLLSMSQWLREGGLEKEWREEKSICPNCRSSSQQITGEDQSFIVCPKCLGRDADVRAIETGSSLPRTLTDQPIASSTPLEPIPPGPFTARQNLTQCSSICRRHNTSCALRTGHRPSHIHKIVDGSVCFFDI